MLFHSASLARPFNSDYRTLTPFGSEWVLQVSMFDCPKAASRSPICFYVFLFCFWHSQLHSELVLALLLRGLWPLSVQTAYSETEIHNCRLHSGWDLHSNIYIKKNVSTY